MKFILAFLITWSIEGIIQIICILDPQQPKEYNQFDGDWYGIDNMEKGK